MLHLSGQAIARNCDKLGESKMIPLHRAGWLQETDVSDENVDGQGPGHESIGRWHEAGPPKSKFVS
jgi:hypothetical protein